MEDECWQLTAFANCPCVGQGETASIPSIEESHGATKLVTVHNGGTIRGESIAMVGIDIWYTCAKFVYRHS